MRIIAIGVGGAGCRIAEALYANDRKSSKVTCVQALAVDIDSDALAQLPRSLNRQRSIFRQLSLLFQIRDLNLPSPQRLT